MWFELTDEGIAVGVEWSCDVVFCDAYPELGVHAEKSCVDEHAVRCRLDILHSPRGLWHSQTVEQMALDHRLHCPCVSCPSLPVLL